MIDSLSYIFIDHDEEARDKIRIGNSHSSGLLLLNMYTLY
jgi:hypothetical protein